MHSYFSTVTCCKSQINTYTVNDLLFITKPNFLKNISGEVILFYEKIFIFQNKLQKQEKTIFLIYIE